MGQSDSGQQSCPMTLAGNSTCSKGTCGFPTSSRQNFLRRLAIFFAWYTFVHWCLGHVSHMRVIDAWCTNINRLSFDTFVSAAQVAEEGQMESPTGQKEI